MVSRETEVRQELPATAVSAQVFPRLDEGRWGEAEAGVESRAEPRSPGASWSIPAIAIAILLLQLLLNALVPGQSAVVSLGIGAAYGLASYVTFRHARHCSGTIRARWMMVALGLAIGAVSSLVTIYRDSLEKIPDDFAGVEDVMLLLRDVPFLIAISLSKRERSLAFMRLDAAQAVIAVCLAFTALLFAFPLPGGGYRPVTNLSALDRIAAASLLIALASIARVFGEENAEERRFFRLMCAFFWANALVSGFLSLVMLSRWHASASSAWLVLGDVPVLALAIACGRVRPGGEALATGNVSFADPASSSLFPAWNFLMTAMIVRSHFYLGMGSLGVSFVLYGIRSTLIQTQYLAVQEALREANDRSRDQALQDALTEIPNRRGFDLTLTREWKRAQRSHQPLALLLLDIDHFKRLNDTFGHPAGDACLKEIAGLLRNGLRRQVDFAARWGGEEFAVLLVDTGLDGAQIVAEGLRRAIEHHSCLYRGRPIPAVTVSIGIASSAPGMQDQWANLVASADTALYRAKRNGRNRVELTP